MSASTEVDDLVSLWQRHRATGRDIPATELCRDRPDLTAAVEVELAALRWMGAVAAAPADQTTAPAGPSPADGPPSRVPGYEILGPLGVGGFGVVYRARQTTLNRLVAIKMPIGRGRAAPKELARFLVEAEAVASVRHRHVVQVHEYGEADGRPFLTMDYLPGGSLADRLARDGLLPPAAAAELVRKLAGAVQAAHDQQVVHRDLKPQNVLFDEVGEPAVTDFGLAKRAAGIDLTPPEAILGTPAYMAPEQARGQGKFVGPAADVWALGVILYECLTGVRPFTGDGNLALLVRVLETEPEPVREANPAVPRDLAVVCHRCLQKKPGDRYPSAGELAADLARFLAGRPVAARPLPARVLASRWVRRHPAPTALAGLVLALLVGGPPLWIWNQGRLEASRIKESAANEKLGRETEAREAADKLAATRGLFVTQARVRQRAREGQTGWVAANKADLARVAAAVPGEEVLAEFRDEAATAITAVDLDRRPAALTGQAVGAVAAGGRFVAVAHLKAWGWVVNFVRLLDPATGVVVRTLQFNSGGIVTGGSLPAQDACTVLAFAPDGRRLYAGTRTGFIHRWDLDAPAADPARTWQASATAVVGLAIRLDGGRVYATAKDAPLTAWDPETGRPAGRSARTSQFVAVCPFAEDGADGTLYVTRGKGIDRLHPDTLAPHDPDLRVVPPDAPAERIAFAPTGLVYAVGDGRRVWLRDPRLKNPVHELLDPDVPGKAHLAGVSGLAWHPSAGLLATFSAAPEDRRVKVWDVASGRLLVTTVVPGAWAGGLTWTADGRQLYVTGGTQVARFELTGLTALTTTAVLPLPVTAAALVNGGQGVAVAGWALQDRHPMYELAHFGLDGRPSYLGGFTIPGAKGRIRMAAAVRPQSWVAIGSEGGRVQVCRPGPPWKRTQAPEMADAQSLLGLSPDGAILWAVRDGNRVEAWRLQDGRRVASWSNRLVATVFGGSPGLTGLAVGRTRVVVAGRDGGVRVLNTTGLPKLAEERMFEVGREFAVTCVGLAPDESVAVVGGRDTTGRVRTFSLATGAELPAPAAHAGEVTAVAVGPGGRTLATGGSDKSVKLWGRAGDGGWIKRVAIGLPASVESVEFDPAGGRLLILLRNEFGVRVLDVGRLRAELAGLGLDWADAAGP